MNSATVVFSIPLLKDAILHYRGSAAARQRTAKLLAVHKGAQTRAWDPLPSGWGLYYCSMPSRWFDRE